jgi:hypothetical protein
MARKGIWDFAATDLNAFAQLLRSHPEEELTALESATLRRFFGPYSYADHKLRESGIFFAGLSDLTRASLRLQVALLLISPLLFELVYSIRKYRVRYFLGTARKCLLFCFMCVRSSRSGKKAVASMSGIQSQ